MINFLVLFYLAMKLRPVSGGVFHRGLNFYYCQGPMEQQSKEMQAPDLNSSSEGSGELRLKSENIENLLNFLRLTNCEIQFEFEF